MMKKYLTKNNYALIHKYNASSKIGDAVIGKTNKNVRTRIYYHQDFVSKNTNNGMTNTENSNSNTSLSSNKFRNTYRSVTPRFSLR